MKDDDYKFPVILFFVAGATLSIEEKMAAYKLGPNVKIRNALLVPVAPSPGQIEQCDGVAGVVPDAYAKLYPSAEDAISTWSKNIADKHASLAAEAAAAADTNEVPPVPAAVGPFGGSPFPPSQ